MTMQNDNLAQLLAWSGSLADERLGRLSFPEAGDPISSARALFGSRLLEIVKSANDRLAADSSDKGAMQEASAAIDLFQALSLRVTAPAFPGVIEAVAGLAPQAAAAIAEDLADTRRCARILGAGIARSLDEPGSFDAFMSSPEGRRAATGRARRAADEAQYFEPLMACIRKMNNVPYRTELMAKVALYIDSGHARVDCVEESDAKLGPNQAAMRDMIHALRLRPDDDSGALEIIKARFRELFVRVNVEMDASVSDGDSMARVVGGQRVDRVAAKGDIDAVIMDARDPSLMHVSVVTSDETLEIEGNSLYRHLRAIDRAIAEGAFSGTALASATRREASMFAPCTLYGEGSEAREQLGAAFLANMRNPLTREERASINLLPHLATLAKVDGGSSALGAAQLAGVRLRLLGASSNEWNASMAEAGGAADRRAAVLRAAAGVVGQAVDVMAKLEAGQDQLRTSGKGGAIIRALSGALEGLAAHAVYTPGELAPLDRRLRAMRALHNRLARDGGDKQAFEKALMPFMMFDGGYRGYARSLAKGRAENAAARAREDSERMADLAATKKFVVDMATERRFKDSAQGGAVAPDPLGLGDALARDASASYGFSKKETAAIKEDLRALENLHGPAAANAMVVLAVERGDMSGIFEAFTKGAGLFACDKTGRPLDEIAAANGHAALAKELSKRIQKRLQDKEHIEGVVAAARMEASSGPR